MGSAGPTPGLLYVDARFTNPDLRTSAFDDWYSNEHIPHLLTMDGVDGAMRYVKTDPTAPAPYLALYPLRDVGWVHSEEFAHAVDSTESDVLPGRSVFKSVDFDGRCYELTQAFEAPDAKSGPAPYAILEAIEPAPTAELAHQHDTLQDLQTLALCDGYIRSRQYRLCSPQRDDWNAKWEREGKWPEKCLTVHEFESTKQGQVDEVKRAREASGGAGALHVSVYRLTGAFGNAEWVG